MFYDSISFKSNIPPGNSRRITAIPSECADGASRALNLTVISSLSDSVGLLLLCEVAARPFHEETNANYNADQACKDNKKL